MLKKIQRGKFQYVVMAAMIGAAFWTGTLYQRVKGLESGNNKPQVAGVAEEQGQQPSVQKAVNLAEADWQKLLENPAAAMGDEGAKVTIVELTDYQCPFCKRYVDETMVELEEEYVKTGKVRYLLRDLPLAFHTNARPAALAARCAGEQGKYFEMHHKLFEDQDSWTSGDAGSSFKKYAGDLGLDVSQFNSCFDGNKFSQQIDDDLSLASKVGASGTPTFFINGKKVVGAQPLSAFKAVIDSELNK